jgi:hypothetical protein
VGSSLNLKVYRRRDLSTILKDALANSWVTIPWTIWPEPGEPGASEKGKTVSDSYLEKSMSAE